MWKNRNTNSWCSSAMRAYNKYINAISIGALSSSSSLSLIVYALHFRHHHGSCVGWPLRDGGCDATTAMRFIVYCIFNEHLECEQLNVQLSQIWFGIFVLFFCFHALLRLPVHAGWIGHHARHCVGIFICYFYSSFICVRLGTFLNRCLQDILVWWLRWLLTVCPLLSQSTHRTHRCCMLRTWPV